MARERYIFVNGELVEASKYQAESQKTSWQVLPDIAPYKSMIDGSVINSRSKHREHLKAHGCEEVGNDSSLRGSPKPIPSPPGLKDAILRSYHDVIERKRR